VWFAGFLLGGWNPAIFSISSGQSHRKRMGDVVIAAVITVGGMVVTVLVNVLFAWRRDVRNRTETFFNNFFTERLKAYQKILGAISEFSIEELDPEPGDIPEIQEVLIKFGETVVLVCADHRLLMDNAVYDGLAELYFLSQKAKDKMKEPISPVAQFCDAVDVFQGEYRKFIELLREKSGIGIIDQEFAKALKGLKNVIPKKNKGFGKDISDQKNRPKKGV
jgi:hypothetical protein